MCTGPRERYKTISLTLSLIYNHFILSLNIAHIQQNIWYKVNEKDENYYMGIWDWQMDNV